MAKKRRKNRKGGRRRGLKGLRSASLTRPGLIRDLVPTIVGIGLTAGATVAVRSFLRPTPGSPAETAYRWAPVIGLGAGALGMLAMQVTGGKSQATSTLVAAVGTAGVLIGMERLHASKPGAFAALVGSGPSAGTAGIGAIVPEYAGGPFATRGLSGPRGAGAIVMEQLNGNQQGQGADVQLQGAVNTAAFGSRPFQA